VNSEKIDIHDRERSIRISVKRKIGFDIDNIMDYRKLTKSKGKFASILKETIERTYKDPKISIKESENLAREIIKNSIDYYELLQNLGITL